jgi:hypothetical protein
MNRAFVKTKNAKLFDSKVASAQQRGAREGGLVVVTGRPGDGKTRTMETWTSIVGGIMLTAQVDWTPRRMMVEMAEKLGIDTKAGFEGRMQSMIVKGNISIVVDEAGFCLDNKAACLEKLRGITDKTTTLLILVFMARDVHRLTQSNVEQLGSRVNARCDFAKNSAEDIAGACLQLSEVPISAELAEHIHQKTDGSMRLAVNAIARIEAVARMRPTEQHSTPMKVADIKGLELFHVLGHAPRKGTAT